jgi:hypothetical protein
VQAGRVYVAGVVLGVSLAAAVWTATYRVSMTYEWIDAGGGRYHAPETFMVSPWWSVPATLAVVAAGLAASVWLLPNARGAIRRSADYFSGLSAPIAKR